MCVGGVLGHEGEEEREEEEEEAAERMEIELQQKKKKCLLSVCGRETSRLK